MNPIEEISDSPRPIRYQPGPSIMIASVKAAAPQLRSNQTIVSDNENWMTQVTGTIPDYFSIRAWPMDSGALFTQQDVDQGSKVVVLGRTVTEADNIWFTLLTTPEVTQQTLISLLDSLY